MNILKNNRGFSGLEILIVGLVALITWAGTFFGCNVHKKDIQKRNAKQEITEEMKKNSSDKTNSKKSNLEEEKYQVEIDKCEFLLDKQEFDKALSACEEAEKIEDNYKIHYLKGQIFSKMGNIDSSRKEFAKALKQAKTSTQRNESKTKFEPVEKFFLSEFLKKDYSERKLLMPIKNAEDIYVSETATLFPIKEMPKISLPIGHPIENELYVAHPYVSTKYTTFDTYETDFLNERLREFCELAQALGATEVNIESVRTVEENYDFTKNANAEIKSNLKIKEGIEATAGPDIKNIEKNSRVESILRGISIHQVFSKPKKEIVLPKNLVWFDHEPSWQQLYRQRMMGNLLEHREKIESKSNRVIQDSELKKFQLELKAGPILSVTPEWEKNIDQQLKQKNDSSVTIQVKFAAPEETTNTKETIKEEDKQPNEIAVETKELD